MITVTLPWPHKNLSPNSRVHWAQKSKQTKLARSEAHLSVRLLWIIAWHKASAKVHFTFHPATNRRRDLDNLISSTKAHRDGIADALGIDDSKFILSAEIGEVRKPACVLVTIS